MVDSTSRSYSFPKKLQFFTRIRHILQLKTARKSTRSSDQFDKTRAEEEEKKEEPEIMKSESPCGIEEDIVVLQRSVKQLHFGSLEDKDAAVKEIKRLASEDLKTRKSLADLGVIPSVVLMLDLDMFDRPPLAIQTL
ncbi:hypothetical protein NE237_026765 [Protea cynaroides]|uniref:Uncharacterized protein n=1 Tax=Protea cynaroides TaxID=273540 RepID=A0A9Q0JRZ1_9MAGN|nr:hypothetical protein NE237_026765 [Protea cynaroides]